MAHPMVQETCAGSSASRRRFVGHRRVAATGRELGGAKAAHALARAKVAKAEEPVGPCVQAPGMAHHTAHYCICLVALSNQVIPVHATAAGSVLTSLYGRRVELRPLSSAVGRSCALRADQYRESGAFGHVGSGLGFLGYGDVVGVALFSAALSAASSACRGEGRAGWEPVARGPGLTHRSAVFGAGREIRPLLAACGFAASGRPGLRLRNRKDLSGVAEAVALRRLGRSPSRGGLGASLLLPRSTNAVTVSTCHSDAVTAPRVRRGEADLGESDGAFEPMGQRLAQDMGRPAGGFRSRDPHRDVRAAGAEQLVGADLGRNAHEGSGDFRLRPAGFRDHSGQFLVPLALIVRPCSQAGL